MSDDRSIKKLNNGKYELSKYWPDHTRARSSRFRRVFATLDLAKAMRARIEHAIVLGTWRELRRDLNEGPAPDLTIEQFAPTFMEHIRTKNVRPDFHQEELDRKPDGILAVLGKVRLKEFMSADAARFERRRGRKVKAATVNRAISVLSYLMTYAVKCGHLTQHPMAGYGRIREQQRALRVMTLEEERAFVAALLRIDLMVGIYAGVMGEAALRPGEADRLEWTHLDFTGHILTVDQAKGKRPRYIPLSPFAVELLGHAIRYPQSKTRRIFIRNTHKAIGDTRAPFAKAQTQTGLTWVHPEDFRHFRATQWVKRGVDLKTVKEYLGHADIHTTMRYAHFAPKFAAQQIIEAQREEALSLAQLTMGFDFAGEQ